jgi:hypothetical protein
MAFSTLPMFFLGDNGLFQLNIFSQLCINHLTPEIIGTSPKAKEVYR